MEPDNPAEISVRDLIAQYQNGSTEAGQRLWDLYGILVRQAVRRRLPQELRPVFDSEDFTQQVFASFFDGIGQIPGMERPAQLVAYLQAMAHNKVIEECRRRITGVRRNETGTCSLDASTFTRSPVADKDAATPSEFAMGKEFLERCQAELPEEYRRIVELRADGLTYKEVGLALGLHENSVRRIMSNLYDRMAE